MFLNGSLRLRLGVRWGNLYSSAPECVRGKHLLLLAPTVLLFHVPSLKIIEVRKKFKVFNSCVIKLCRRIFIIFRCISQIPMWLAGIKMCVIQFLPKEILCPAFFDHGLSFPCCCWRPRQPLGFL